jgi:WD40 repeat protein
MISGAVLCVEWAPNGSQLVSGGGVGDYTVKLWSPSTGECLNTLKGHRYLLCCAACASSPLRGRGVEQLQVKLSNHLQS